jgi:hypothetical protein
MATEGDNNQERCVWSDGTRCRPSRAEVDKDETQEIVFFPDRLVVRGVDSLEGRDKGEIEIEDVPCTGTKPECVQKRCKLYCGRNGDGRIILYDPKDGGSFVDFNDWAADYEKWDERRIASALEQRR